MDVAKKLLKRAYAEIYDSLKKHEPELSKTERRKRAEALLAERLQKAREKDEKFKASVKDSAYQSSLEIGHRKELAHVLSRTPGTKHKTAKKIIRAAFPAYFKHGRE